MPTSIPTTPMRIGLSKVWKGKGGKYYFRGRNLDNGKTVIPSQGYSTKQKAEQTRKRLDEATIVLDD